MPQNRKHISTPWVIYEKRDEMGKGARHKGIWVDKRFMKAHGVDYYHTHAPFPKLQPNLSYYQWRND